MNTRRWCACRLTIQSCLQTNKMRVRSRKGWSWKQNCCLLFSYLRSPTAFAINVFATQHSSRPTRNCRVSGNIQRCLWWIECTAYSHKLSLSTIGSTCLCVWLWLHNRTTATTNWMPSVMRVNGVLKYLISNSFHSLIMAYFSWFKTSAFVCSVGGQTNQEHIEENKKHSWTTTKQESRRRKKQTRTEEKKVEVTAWLRPSLLISKCTNESCFMIMKCEMIVSVRVGKIFVFFFTNSLPFPVHSCGRNQSYLAIAIHIFFSFVFSLSRSLALLYYAVAPSKYTVESKFNEKIQQQFSFCPRGNLWVWKRHGNTHVDSGRDPH